MCAPRAGTLVSVGEVDTGAPILAGLGQALIGLLGTVGPMVASHTLWEQGGQASSGADLHAQESAVGTLGLPGGDG